MAAPVWKKLVLQVFAALVPLTVLLFKYGFHNWDIRQWVVAIFWLVFTQVATDKVTSIIERTKDEEAKQAKAAEDARQWAKFRAEVASLIAQGTGHNDLRSFNNSDEGLQYCNERASHASSVKNTVIRYVSPNQSVPYNFDHVDGPLYADWVSAKENAIRNNCHWTDLISSHLAPERYSHGLVNAFGQSVTANYKVKYLNESRYPMMQLTIFRLKSGTREAVVGWQFPGFEHGPSFLATNASFIDFLEHYFDHFFKLAEPHPSPPKRKSEKSLQQKISAR